MMPALRLHRTSDHQTKLYRLTVGIREPSWVDQEVAMKNDGACEKQVLPHVRQPADDAVDRARQGVVVADRRKLESGTAARQGLRLIISQTAPKALGVVGNSRTP